MSTSDPIQYLCQQYVRVLDHLQVLALSLETLSKGNRTPENFEALLGVAQEIRSEVWAHSERVEAALFPVLEPLIANDEVASVVRREHRAYRRGMSRLVKLISELKEHPENLGLFTEVADSSEVLSGLLAGSVRSEEEVLYPLARQFLSREQCAEVQRRLDRFGLGEEPKDAFLETEEQHEGLLHIISGLAQVVRELRQGKLSEEDRRTFTQAQKAMAYEIKGHNRIEEEILFPAMEKVPALSKLIRDLLEEHRLQWQRLKEVSVLIKKGPSPKAGETLERLVQDQALHIYKENIILFPMARLLLTPTVLRNMARQAKAFQRDIHRKKDIQD